MQTVHMKETIVWFYNSLLSEGLATS